MYSSMDVGTSCLMAQPEPAAFLICLQHLRLHDFTNLEGVARVIQTVFFVADIADVDHSFDPVTQIDEGAELGQTGDGCLNRGPTDTSSTPLPMGRQRLLQAQCNPLVAPFTPSTTTSTMSSGLTNIRRATFLRVQDISET